MATGDSIAICVERDLVFRAEIEVIEIGVIPQMMSAFRVDEELNKRLETCRKRPVPIL